MNGNMLLQSIALPILAGITCLFMPDRVRGLVKSIAILVASLSVFYSVKIFMQKPLCWPTEGPRIFVADNLSGFIGIGISIFTILVTIYSFGYIGKSFGRYFGYILMTLGSSLGVAFSNNFIALLVFWRFLGLTLYILVNMSESKSSSEAAKKAIIIIGGTDAIMIFGIGLVWMATGNFSMEITPLSLNTALPLAAYLSIAIASFAKAGAIPFHSWLPDVAEHGPTPVTAYLPASLDKLLGIYLLARASLNLFAMNNVSNFILLSVGSITIILAVLFALVQHDLKRLLGYHAVSQVGYMVLGIGTGNPIGIAGGIFHMINHAIYKSCLFLASGNVEKETQTTDLDKLGGLARYMPVTFISFLIASLSISGIPPFNGFVSKWMIYQGIIESASAKNPLWVVWLSCAMFGSALTLASFMKLLHSVFLGRSAADFSRVKESPLSMTFPVMVLAALCVIFGILAFSLPLAIFIAPAISKNIVYLGVWQPVLATFLIFIGIIIGLFVYFVSRHKAFRSTAPFVGGEDASGLARVSGTEFYDTIKNIKWLGRLYGKEEAKLLDIYEVGSRGTFSFSGILQWLHNGILPTYMVWCLVGMLILFFILMK